MQPIHLALCRGLRQRLEGETGGIFHLRQGDHAGGIVDPSGRLLFLYSRASRHVAQIRGYDDFLQLHHF